MRYDTCARCCTTRTMSMHFSNDSANTVPSHSNAIESNFSTRPKRDFQFQVIQVRQGPKWFIWPSLSSHTSKKKEEKNKIKNVENVENNNKENNNNVKETKTLLTKTSNGYVSGSGSDQENAGTKNQISSSGETLSPTSSISPSGVIPSNYNNNCFNNTQNLQQHDQQQQRVPLANDVVELSKAQDGMVKVTATNKMFSYPTPFSEPTTRRFPPYSNSVFLSNMANQVISTDGVYNFNSTLNATLKDKNNFCCNNGVFVSEGIKRQFIQSQVSQQLSKQDNALIPPFSVVNPTLEKHNCTIPVVDILNDNKVNVKKNQEAASQNVSTTLNQPTSTASSAFEILAVSKKDDDEDDFMMDDEDVNSSSKNFADSGYCPSASVPLMPAQKINRSSSVVEYYSNSGCYTCISGECLLLNNTYKNEADDVNKKFRLCNSATDTNNDSKKRTSVIHN